MSVFQKGEAEKELSASNDDLSENNTPKVSSVMRQKLVNTMS